MILKRSGDNLAVEPNRPLICESCGAEFGCAAAQPSKCWCMNLDLDEATRQEINSKFNDCLCPECLAKYSPGQLHL